MKIVQSIQNWYQRKNTGHPEGSRRFEDLPKKLGLLMLRRHNNRLLLPLRIDKRQQIPVDRRRFGGRHAMGVFAKPGTG
jgi:hypothetical protein